jgi:chaperonin GroEL (HSP60 family)
MLVDEIGEVTITNDGFSDLEPIVIYLGATILKQLEV